MKFLLGFLAVSILRTALLIRLAPPCQWIVPPRPDRWSPRVVAKFGGVLVLVTFVGSALCLPLDRRLAGIVGLTALMGLLGFLDDLFQLSASKKLVVQTLLSTAAVGFGVSYAITQNAYLNGLCTVLWLGGIYNTFH